MINGSNVVGTRELGTAAFVDLSGEQATMDKLRRMLEPRAGQRAGEKILEGHLKRLAKALLEDADRGAPWSTTADGGQRALSRTPPAGSAVQCCCTAV